MIARHYDAIILGRSIGALLTAALLSRRELRVLVLGQGQGSPHYQVEGHHLPRRAFSMLAATSPVFRRILQELAQSQRFKLLTTPLDPIFGVFDNETRFEVAPSNKLFQREIEREYPEVQQSIAELYAQISLTNAQIDSVFDKDVVWPPGTLIEKMETGRFTHLLTKAMAQGNATDLLGRLPQGHRYEHVVNLPALFSSHLGIEPSASNYLSLARLHGSWTRGVHSLPLGEKDLEDFLVARIEAQGGSCRLNSSAEELVIERGKVIGIREEGEEEVTATEAVVSSDTGEILAELSGGAGISKKARDTWPHVEIVGGRFIVNLIVNNEGLPSPLPQHTFLVAGEAGLPHVHLHRMTAPTHTTADEENPTSQSRSLLVAETLLPKTGGVHLLGARQATLAVLRKYLPFIDEHLVVVDSPHDGMAAWCYEKDQAQQNIRRDIERIHLKGAQVAAEKMIARLGVDPPGYLGIGGEHLRGPISGSYLVGPSVLPGLGQEGEILAAWGVAKILTKKDRTRQKLRRQMWTKVETN